MISIILTIIYTFLIFALLYCINILITRGNRKLNTYLYIGCLMCVTLWSLSQILIFVSNSISTLTFSYFIGNLGICFIGSFWLNFTYDLFYKFKKKYMIFITMSFSLIMYGSILTNIFHKFYYTRFTLNEINYGIGFWIMIIYDYLCVIIGIILIFYNEYKIRQSISVKLLLAVSVTIPLIFNLLFLTNLVNTRFDLTPIGFSISCILVMVIIFKHDFFDIKIRAFDKMMLNMPDGIIMFNKHGELVYKNDCADDYFQSLKINNIAKITKSIININEFNKMFNEKQMQEIIEKGETILITNKDTYIHIQKYVFDNLVDKYIGTAYIGRDITKYYQLENANRELLICANKIQIQEERGKIIQYIHDTIGHELTMIRSLIKLASKSANEDNKSSSLSYLDSAEEITRNCTKELRLAINRMKEENVNEYVTLGIIQLINSVDEIKIELTIHGEESMKYSYLSEVLYSNLRECITNTLKYGNAHNMQVIIRFNEDNLEMYIYDDGQGCEKIVIGNGLQGILERTNSNNGTVKFVSNTMEGFGVIMKFNL